MSCNCWDEVVCVCAAVLSQSTLALYELKLVWHGLTGPARSKQWASAGPDCRGKLCTAWLHLLVTDSALHSTTMCPLSMTCRSENLTGSGLHWRGVCDKLVEKKMCYEKILILRHTHTFKQGSIMYSDIIHWIMRVKQRVCCRFLFLSLAVWLEI